MRHNQKYKARRNARLVEQVRAAQYARLQEMASGGYTDAVERNWHRLYTYAVKHRVHVDIEDVRCI